ncbi:MAG: CPBP family glutamic-type intramembrane protease [Oligoflexales bacterium]
MQQQRYNLRLSSAVCGCLCFSVFLAELYQFGVDFFYVLPWQSALVFHAFLVFILFFLEKNSSIQRVTLKLCGVFAVLHSLSHLFNLSIPLWMLTWIPLVEEWVFRRGLGGALQVYLKKDEHVIYLQAMTFSFLHSWPTFDRISVLEIGLVPGAFFLGLVTGFIFQKTRSLLAVVGLHSAGNLCAWIIAASS